MFLARLIRSRNWDSQKGVTWRSVWQRWGSFPGLWSGLCWRTATPQGYQAELAREPFQRESKRRVVVLDNASIHKSKAVRAKEARWRECGLSLFFLPTYFYLLGLLTMLLKGGLIGKEKNHLCLLRFQSEILSGTLTFLLTASLPKKKKLHSQTLTWIELNQHPNYP